MTLNFKYTNIYYPGILIFISPPPSPSKKYKYNIFFSPKKLQISWNGELTILRQMRLNPIKDKHFLGPPDILFNTALTLT